MSMQTPPSSYGRVAIALHWIVFALIAIGWGLGSYMADLPFSPQKLRYVSYHKWIGVTIFVIAALRLSWRLGRGVPPLPPMPVWQRRAATTVHALLYALILTIPITGWLFSSASGVPTVYLGLFQLPDLIARNKALATNLRDIHEILNWMLLAVVCGHVAFALKHHFVDRDEVLERMLPAVRARSR